MSGIHYVVSWYCVEACSVIHGITNCPFEEEEIHYSGEYADCEAYYAECIGHEGM